MLKRKLKGALLGLTARIPGMPRDIRARSFNPGYGDLALNAMLLRAPAVQNSPGIQASLDAARSGQPDQLQALLVQHFDNRVSPRFFVDPRSVLSDPSRFDARLPEWMNRAGEEMRDATEAGLRSYGDITPPLRPGYPWGVHHGSIPRADPLFPIRPHRFGFAPRFALAVIHGALPVERFTELLDDWMRFSATHPSLPFRSNLVVTQRLFASAWAFHFLAVHPRTAACIGCRHRLLQIIGQDIAYLMPRLGSSYPNNHLLLDRFVDWFIAVCYPEFVATARNEGALEARWIDELYNQTYADGGGVEHSVHYQGLACEMAAAYLLLARANGRALPDGIEAHVGRMLGLQAGLCGSDGFAAQLGDSSDDPLFPLDSGNGGNAAVFREIYRALFDAALPAIRQDHPAVERAFWLLGGLLAPDSPAPGEIRLAEYPQAGIVIFSDHADATRCTFRTGPVAGLKVLPGHMHADLMSVTLTLEGQPLLVDAGTYTYRFRPDARTVSGINWRDYFAGPRAHNGLIAGTANPIGPLTGNFRPLAALPNVRHVARGGGAKLAFLEAEMQSSEGHPALTRGVVHMGGLGLIVYDLVNDAMPASDLQLAFQLDAKCEVQRVANNCLAVSRGAAVLGLSHSAGLGPAAIVSGREAPTNGWVSYGYGQRVPAPQLIFERAHDCALTAFTLLYGEPRGSTTVECRRSSAGLRGFRLESAGFTDFVLLNAGPSDTASEWGITFCGRLAWIRISRDRPPAIRWLDGTSCEIADYGVFHRVHQPAAEFAAN